MGVREIRFCDVCKTTEDVRRIRVDDGKPENTLFDLCIAHLAWALQECLLFGGREFRENVSRKIVALGKDHKTVEERELEAYQKAFAEDRLYIPGSAAKQIAGRPY